MRLTIACSLIVLAGFGASSQAQVLVKCVDASGKSSYSDTACPASTASNVVQTTVVAMPDVIYGSPAYVPHNTGSATATFESGTASTWRQREAAFQNRRYWRGVRERTQEHAIARQQQAYHANAMHTTATSVKIASATPRAGGHAGGGHK